MCVCVCVCVYYDIAMMPDICSFDLSEFNQFISICRKKKKKIFKDMYIS